MAEALFPSPCCSSGSPLRRSELVAVDVADLVEVSEGLILTKRRLQDLA